MKKHFFYLHKSVTFLIISIKNKAVKRLQSEGNKGGGGNRCLKCISCIFTGQPNFFTSSYLLKNKNAKFPAINWEQRGRNDEIMTIHFLHLHISQAFYH